MLRVYGTSELALAKERYAQEKRVAVSLAKHVAALLTAANRYSTDWRVVYRAAHVREAKAVNPKLTKEPI